MKKPLVVALFGLSAAALLNVPGQKVKPVSAGLPEGTKNAIKISIDTSSDKFKGQYAEGIGDDAYLAYATAPLPSTSDADGGYAFRSNRLGHWWDPWENITISYDFWTNHFMPGMNGVGVYYQDSWAFSKNADVKDQNGYTATCFDEAYLAQYGNGWVHREFSIPATEKIVLDMWLTCGLNVGALRNTNEVIDMYYTNLKVKYDCGGATNQIVDLFGTENSIYTIEEINKTANDTAVADGWTKKEWGIVYGLGWDGIHDMSGLNCRQCVEARTLTAVDTLPDVPEITLNAPESLLTGQEYNLLGYATSTGTVSIESILKDGVAIDTSSADFSQYTFTDDGNFTISYKSEKGDITCRTSVVIPVADLTTPIFTDADIVAAVPATANAHETVKLGKVLASVNGVKNLPTTPVVKNSTGDVFEVTAVEDGFTFKPTNKKSDTYTVHYVATNEGKTVNSIEKTITVTDVDRPVIDFSSLTSFDVGCIYDVEEIKGLISITDISDGELGVAELSIKDPLGNECVDTTGKFMAMYSGKYVVKATSEQDSDGNSTEGQIELGTNQSEGLVLAQIIEVPEENRTEGVVKSGRSQVWHTDYSFSLGDKLVYDVMAYTEDGNGSFSFIPGVGGIGGQLNGDWKHVDALFAETESLDADGQSMARTTDLSSKLHDADNKPVWYHREYTVKQGDAVIYGNQYWHFAVTFETSAACGEKITVLYKNVYIYDAEGELKGTLWNGTQTVGDEWDEKQNVSNIYIGASVDVVPVAIAGKVPSTASYGSTVTFPKGLMKDPMTDTVLNSTVSIKDPSGSPVEVSSTDTSYSFVAEKLGNYTLTVSASNSKFTSTEVYQIAVTDTVKPEVALTVEKEAYIEGDTVKVEVAISDNHTAFADLKDSGVVVTKDGETIQATVTETENGYSVSFVGEKGTYSITAYATDASNNETVENLNIEVAAKPAEKKGCGGSMIAGSAIVTMFALAGVSFLGSKKRKEK